MNPIEKGVTPELRERVKNAVIKVVRYYLKHWAENEHSDRILITGSTRVIKDLGLDSLDGIDLIMLIEDEFQFRMVEEEVGGLNTIDEITEHVVTHVSEQRLLMLLRKQCPN